MASNGNQDDADMSLYMNNTSFVPESAPGFVQDGSCILVQQFNPLQLDETVVKDRPESEDIMADTANSEFQNPESAGNIQDTGFSIQNIDCLIDEHDVDAEAESHANGDPASINEVHPDSEKVTQNANTNMVPQLLEIGNQFIKRTVPHEDVMDAINSTFKFAKMGTPHFSKPSLTMQSNGTSADASKGSKATEISLQHELPLRPTLNISPDEPLDGIPIQPNAQDKSLALILNLARQEITVTSPGMSRQPPPFSEGDILYPKSVLGLETSFRKSQLTQKALFNTRLKIKHPFPEVAQNAPDSKAEHDQSQLHRKPIKSNLGSSGSHPTHHLISQAPDEDGGRLSEHSRQQLPQLLNHKVPVAQSLDAEVTGSPCHSQMNFSIPLTVSNESGSFAGNAQTTIQDLSLVRWRPDIRRQLRDDVPYPQSPREKPHKDILSLETLEDLSMGTNCSEHLVVGSTTNIRADNSTSEIQVPMDSIQRLTSSPLQQQTCYNHTIPISINSPEAGPELRSHFDSGRVRTWVNNPGTQESKSRHDNNKKTNVYNSSPSQRPQLLSHVMRAQQNLIKHSQEVEDILNDYQRQKEILKVQQSELERLKVSITERSEKVQTLETEKEALKVKIKKMELLSIKYKNHMNEVVIAQKHLIKESQKIQKVQIDAKLFQISHDSREAHIKKLESLLREAKEFRAPAEKLLAVKKENTDLINAVQESSKINKLLQSDLDKNAIDLGRERHNVSQLQKQLTVQSESHHEIIGYLNTIRSGILEDLTGESGMLMKILQSEDSIQEKIERVSCYMNSVKSYSEDLQRASDTVSENVSIGMEKILQTTEINRGFLQESQSQHFEALKERVDQLHHDQKTEIQLKAVIGDLREKIANISSTLNAREDKCQGLATRVNDLESELDSCRSLLNTKCDDLAIANASSKENSILKLRSHDLERENRTLQGEVDSMNLRTASIMDELATARTTSREAEKELRQLTDKYNDTQTLIKKFSEEKKTYMSNAKLDVEKARQEVAKASMAAKNELIMRHDALAKNLEQRRSEAEINVSMVKEELQRLQDDRDKLARNTAQLKDELSTAREESAQRAKYIDRLETQHLGIDALNLQESVLKSVHNEISTLKKNLESIQGQFTETLNAASQTIQEVQTGVRDADDLKKEHKSLQEENAILQKKLTALSVSLSQLAQAPGPNPSSEHTTRAQVSCGIDTNSILPYSSQYDGGPAPLAKRTPFSQLKIANREAPGSKRAQPTTTNEQTAICDKQGSAATDTPHSSHESSIVIEVPFEEIIPFSNFSPLRLQPPSSLPDISLVVDEIGIPDSQQDLCKMFTARGDGNQENLSQPSHSQASESRKWPKLAKQPPEPVPGKYGLCYQPLSNKRNDPPTTDRSNVEKPSARELQEASFDQKITARQKTSVPLKSALKKSASVNQPTTNPSLVSNAPAALKSAPPRRGVNKSQRKSVPELGYKRVASGQVAKSKGDGANIKKLFDGVDVPDFSSPSQLTKIVEKSPLIPGPKRNDRKRSASLALGGEDGSKTTKAPRTSLRFKSTISDHNSPIVPDLQSNKPHATHRH